MACDKADAVERWEKGMNDTLQVQKITAFKDYVRAALPPTIRKRSGAVLYGKPCALRRGNFYFLGLNPGGEPDATLTIERNIELWDDLSRPSMLDEQWGSSPSGRAVFQQRLRWLIASLGEKPHQVAVSNLYFVRSRSAATGNFGGLGEVCWKVHEYVIQIVQPKALIVYGNGGGSPYAWLKRRFGAAHEDSRPSGHGDWRCRRFLIPDRFWVIGLPHLSRYNVIGKPEIARWVMGTLEM